MPARSPEAKARELRRKRPEQQCLSIATRAAMKQVRAGNPEMAQLILEAAVLVADVIAGEYGRDVDLEHPQPRPLRKPTILHPTEDTTVIAHGSEVEVRQRGVWVEPEFPFDITAVFEYDTAVGETEGKPKNVRVGQTHLWDLDAKEYIPIVPILPPNQIQKER